MDVATDGMRKLIDKREIYRQELALRINQKISDDDFMIEVYQKLLGDVERQLDYKKE